jgi:hypothetical protein
MSEYVVTQPVPAAGLAEAAGALWMPVAAFGLAWLYFSAKKHRKRRARRAYEAELDKAWSWADEQAHQKAIDRRQARRRRRRRRR